MVDALLSSHVLRSFHFTICFLWVCWMLSLLILALHKEEFMGIAKKFKSFITGTVTVLAWTAWFWLRPNDTEALVNQETFRRAECGGRCCFNGQSEFGRVNVLRAFGLWLQRWPALLWLIGFTWLKQWASVQVQSCLVCGLSNVVVKMRGGHSASKKTLKGHSEIAFSLTCLLFFKLWVIATGFFNYLFSASWDPVPESCRAPCMTCPSVRVCLAKCRGFLQQVSGNVGTVQLTPLKEYIAKVLPWWVILAVLVSHVNVNLYLV